MNKITEKEFDEILDLVVPIDTTKDRELFLRDIKGRLYRPNVIFTDFVDLNHKKKK